MVRKYAIGKGYSVSVLSRGGQVDTIYGFDTEHAAMEWIGDGMDERKVSRMAERSKTG